MIYLLTSIILLTTIFHLAYRFKVVTFCPICAGVVITWVIGLIASYLNAAWVNPVFVGLLMAGSIGALADKYGTQMGLIWKSLLVVIGLPAVYFVMEKDYKLGTLLAVLTLVLVILFIGCMDQLFTTDANILL